MLMLVDRVQNIPLQISVDSTDALEAFLRRNKLSHVIRAHEVKATGFQVIMHAVGWAGVVSCSGVFIEMVSGV